MPEKSNPLLKHNRREALVALALWLVAMIYTVGYCVRLGYLPAEGDVRLVAGIPAWFVWGIITPWAMCIAAAGWFAFGFMTDDTLE
jgi:hypothetical protein